MKSLSLTLCQAIMALFGGAESKNVSDVTSCPSDKSLRAITVLAPTPLLPTQNEQEAHTRGNGRITTSVDKTPTLTQMETNTLVNTRIAKGTDRVPLPLQMAL
tara:strand:+ start:82 stop:390 length:309 start_codon:yes stop_codon:yes gene_type:complete